jgi:membrane protease YdiL (CAAX protease family)
MMHWFEDATAAIEQIAKAEIKLFLVAVCMALLLIPASMFVAVRSGEIDVDLRVYGCTPALAAGMQNWIADQQRAGVAATVAPFPGSDAPVSSAPARYQVHYLASGSALYAVAATLVPEPFHRNCMISEFQASGTGLSPFAVSPVAGWLSLYASIALLVPWSLMSRREGLVPNVPLARAIRAVPLWCVPLGAITMFAATGLVILGQYVSIDIMSVRDSGPMLVEFVRNHPWLAMVMMGLAAPVFEELLFRRWVLDGFLRASMPVLGSIVVSANFALAHLTNYGLTTAFASGFALFFLISIVLCWVYVRTRNVLACIVVHVAHNCSSALVLSLGGS